MGERSVPERRLDVRRSGLFRSSSLLAFCAPNLPLLTAPNLEYSGSFLRKAKGRPSILGGPPLPANASR
jgi:hypothetical protein